MERSALMRWQRLDSSLNLTVELHEGARADFVMDDDREP